MTKKQQEEIDLLKELIALDSTTSEDRETFQKTLSKYQSEEPKVEKKTMPKKAKATPKPKAKPKASLKPKVSSKQATKLPSDVDAMKKAIKERTGKTEAECEDIIAQYRKLRAKAKVNNAKRTEKLKADDKLIAGTNVITPVAQIEKDAEIVKAKIEKQVEQIENKAEREVVKTDKTKDEIKVAVEKKVVKELAKLSNDMVLKSLTFVKNIQTELKKVDKTEAKNFLLGLRNEIDVLLSRFSDGGILQTYNIAENMSVSSVNPSKFARGGGVKSNTNDVRVKALIKNLDNTPYSIGLAILRERLLTYTQNDLKIMEENPSAFDNFFISNGMYRDYFNRVIEELKFDYEDGGSVDGGDYVREDLNFYKKGGGVDDDFTMKDGSKMNKNEWYQKMEEKMGFEKFAERELKDAQFGRVINAPLNELTHNRLDKKAVIGKNSVTISSYTPNYKRHLDSITFYSVKELNDYLNKNQILADGGSVDGGDYLREDLNFYKTGGSVGKKSTYIPNEDIESLKTNYGQTILGENLLDGAYATGKVKKPKMSRTQFEDESFEFDGGGNVNDIDYNEILEVLKEKLEDSIQELPMDYESADNFNGEEVEHESRDGFIPYTNGGYEVTWFETISYFSSSGKSLPTSQLDDEMQRQVDNNYKYAKQRFIEDEEYAQIVEELGEDNINYSSLYEAGYESEAEQLSEWEMDFDGDDTILCEIGAYYYDTENYRGIDGKNTIRLYGLVNLESPYHRRGNLDDSYDIDITFDSISELKEKIDAGLKEITNWFDGKYYKDSNAEMKITRMADGGEVGEFAMGGKVSFVNDFTLEDGIQVSEDKTTDGKTFYSAQINSYPLHKIIPMNENKDLVVKRAKQLYNQMLEYNKNETDIINKIQYYPKGIPPMNHKYGVRYKGKTYSSNDTDDLVEKVLLETNKMADGGLIGNQKRIDLNENGKIDAEDFKLLRSTRNGAWRNDHKYVNSTSRNKKGKLDKSEVRYAKKNSPSRTGYKGKTNYAMGGKLPEWAVTITSEDGDTYDWVGFANNEDDALYKAEMEAGFESVESGVTEITDSKGNKIEYAKGGEIKLKIKNIDSFDKYYDEVGFTKKQMSLPKQDSNKNWFTTTKDKSIAEQLISDGFVEKFADGGDISHYVINGKVFVDYMDAVNYADQNNLSTDEIKKTKQYAKGGMLKPRLKKGDDVLIIGRRWFDKVNGNTYHTAELQVNGNFVAKSGMQYGYGDNYVETGKELLLQNYKLPIGFNEKSPLYQLRDKKITFRSFAYDGLKRDLAKGGGIDGVPQDIKERLEYLRGEIRNESISYEELIELQSLAEYIEPNDVELLEPANVPEFEDEYVSSCNVCGNDKNSSEMSDMDNVCKSCNYAKGGKVGEFKNIMENNIITEKEVNLIKMRMNNNRVDETTQEVIDYIWDNSPQLTPDQNKKGIDYLRNLWKSPTGKVRTNNPFGYREQETLDTFEYFELRGFYDAGNYNNKFYVPLYNCVGADSSFEYAFYGGKVNILG